MKIPAFLTLSFSFCLLALAQDQSSVPVIVVTSGNSWTTNGKPLVRGQKLQFESSLNQSGTQPSELILDCFRGGWLSYSCKKLPCTMQACQKPSADISSIRVDLQAGGENSSSQPTPSWLSSLFKHEPSALAVLGVREGGHPNDAVIGWTGSQIYLGPALSRVLEGKYCLRFTPLPPGNAAATKQAVLEWDRTTEPRGPISITGLQPGLYTVERSASEAAGACTFDPDPTPAWILITGSSDYPSLDAQWKSIKPQIHQLELEGASPTVLLTVSHAALAHLADSAH